MSSKPSLVRPDLNGLFSVCKLGEDRTTFSKIVGTGVLMLFTCSWVAGFVFPLFVVFVWSIGYHTAAIITFSMVMLPYLFPMSPQPTLCRFYSKYGASYFEGSCSLSFEGEPRIRDPKTPMCVGLHPHGVFCISAFLTSARSWGGTTKEKGTEFIGYVAKYCDFVKRFARACVAQGYLVKAPIFNFLFTQAAGLVPASRKNVKGMMKKKQSFFLLPGGFEGAAAFKRGENSVHISTKKGFIKYCLQFGYEIVPVYSFGECETYRNVLSSGVSKWLSQRKLPCVFPVGPYWFLPFLPFANLGLHAILSKNTRCEHVENPTQDQIDEVHDWYVKEINELFERNKWRFGYADDTKLKIL